MHELISTMIWEMNNGCSKSSSGLVEICQSLYGKPKTCLYRTNIRYKEEIKTLFTIAASDEQASEQFNYYLACRWAEYNFDPNEPLLQNMFDLIEDGSIVPIVDR